MIKYIVNKSNLILNNKYKLSVIIFSLFSAWVLSFSFEGQSLYAIADYHSISIGKLNIYIMIFELLGLFLCKYFVKNISSAKKVILITILFCLFTAFSLFFSVYLLWSILLIISSFFVGCSIASWGYFLKNEDDKLLRFKLIADCLIGSNILMMLFNTATVYISPIVSLILIILTLLVTFILLLKYPNKSEVNVCNLTKSTEMNKSLILLCVFIIVITITSGLMYRIQLITFAHINWLISLYFAVPYIIAILIMRNLSNKYNRSYMLYGAIAMIGFSFIGIMLFNHSSINYIIINTLMLGAYGIYDLFWWSILGDMLDMDKNASKIFGIGLSANILGILLGELIGHFIIDFSSPVNPTLIVLSVLLIAVMILPLLNRKLSFLFKDNIYFASQSNYTNHATLSKRENQIVSLLIEGKTYKMISIELNVSENTIKYHVKNIYSKLYIQSRTELINVIMKSNEK